MERKLTDDELRQRFSALSMPEEPALHFDVDRLADRLKPNPRPFRGARRWYGVAAVAAAFAIASVPVALRGHTAATHPPRPRSHATGPVIQKSWQWHPVDISSFHMVSANDGIALGVQNGRVYRTTSGVGHWRWVGSMPSTPDGGGVTVSRVFSMQRMVSMVASAHGNKAVVFTQTSRDGGRHWQTSQVTVPGEKLMITPTIYSSDFQAAWATAQDGAFLIAEQAHSGFNHVKLYLTHNEGQHWKWVPGTVPGAGQLSMSSANRVWLVTQVGGSLWELNAVSGHWTRILSLGSQRVIATPKFWDGGRDGVVLTKAFSAQLGIWTTHDGGKTWQMIGMLPDHQNGPLLPQLDVTNARDWWIWIPPASPNDAVGTLWSSSDGGHSWSTFPGMAKQLNLPAKASLESLQFLNHNVAFGTYGVGTNSRWIAATTNGGRSWTRVTPEARLPNRFLTLMNGKLWG